MTALFHLAPTTEVHRAARKGEYAPNSLSTDGFIHCAYAHQVQAIADELFRDSNEVTLLEIDPARVTSRIAEERAPSGDRYPHIYGPLPMTAVTTVRELQRGSDGRFSMPCAVTGNCACKNM